MGTLSDLLQSRGAPVGTLSPSGITSSHSIVERRLTGGFWERRDLLEEAHRPWHTRVEQITRIANGEWYLVWPDLTREPSAPTVANIIEMGIAHVGAIGGAVVPSVSVPVPHGQNGADGTRGAERRERRIRELRAKSNIADMLARLWQDYAGTGSAMLGVWANFEEDDLGKRNPYYFRVDPRFAFPVKDTKGNVTELLMARKRHSYDLTREYPWLPNFFKDINQADIEEWIWWDNDVMMHALADVSAKGRKAQAGLILSMVENKMGRVPVVEMMRPTFDGERRGQFDQVVHILRIQHQLMTMTVEASEQTVWPAVGGYEVEGLNTFGPGATLRYRTSDSRVDVFPAAQHFDVKDLIARLEDNARSQGVYPQQLSGEPGASIVSARGVRASMGALDARLALAHRQFEWGLGIADGMLLQVDEVYCDAEKTIYGDHHDRKAPEMYRPSKHVAGNYEVAVSYGIGAGSDPANREIRLHMNLQAGLLSRDSARNQLDIEDASMEDIKVTKEATYDAIRMGVLQMAAQGNPAPAAKLLQIIAEDPDITVEEAMLAIVEDLTGGEGEEPQQAGDPFSAIEAGEALARGGGPNADGMSGFGLPSLPSIAAPGAPSQAL